MIKDNEEMENYYIVRFEDMIDRPNQFIEQLFEIIGLDLSEVPKFGLKAKRSMNKDGTRKLMFVSKEGERVWVPMEKLGEYIRKDVNKNQIQKLKIKEKEEFLENAISPMKLFNYIKD